MKTTLGLPRWMFWTLLAAVLIAMFSPTIAAKLSPHYAISWLGSFPVGPTDKYDGAVKWIPGVEIGLRSDGVVIWREKKNLP